MPPDGLMGLDRLPDAFVRRDIQQTFTLAEKKRIAAMLGTPLNLPTKTQATAAPTIVWNDLDGMKSFKLRGITQMAANDTILYQLSSDNGLNWITSGVYSVSRLNQYNTTVSADLLGSQGGGYLVGGTAAAAYLQTFILELFNLQGSIKAGESSCWYVDTSNNNIVTRVHQRLASALVPNALRLITGSGGNITMGVLDLQVSY